MCTIITLMQLLIAVSAIVPDADIRHADPKAGGEESKSLADFYADAAAPHADIRHPGPTASESARLAENIKDDEKRVHEAAAAARKTAHGDGSDSFANSLEKSMMALEEEDHEMQEKAKQRHAQREVERKVQQDIQHTSQVAHERAASMSPEDAAEQVIETANSIRKNAHGDGSDSFANELEETVIDLEEEKRENEAKAKERHARHEHEHQVRAQQVLKEHEAREQALHEAALAKSQALAHAQVDEAVRKIHQSESNPGAVVRTTALDEQGMVDHSNEWAEQLENAEMRLDKEKHGFEEKDKERRARHALDNQVREEVLRATEPQNGLGLGNLRQPLIGAAEAKESEAEVMQSGAGLGFFLVIAFVVGLGLWWLKFVNSDSHSVRIPGIGKVNMVKSERMFMGLFNGVDRHMAPNPRLDVYGDDIKASASLTDALSYPKGGYGAFTL